MKWEPEQQNLRGLLILLRDASDPNNLDYSIANQRLLSFQQVPDYNAYLIHILTKVDNIDISIRLFAGSQLKSFITKSFNSLPLFALDYIKECCLEYFKNLTEQETNKTVSSTVSLIVRYGQLHNWIDIIQLLMNNLTHKDIFTVKLSLDTLVNICRDVAPELDQPEYGIQPLETLLPQLVKFYSHQDIRIRFQALHATSQFILLKPPSFVDQLNLILTTMYNTTIKDEETCIRQEFTRIVTTLLEAFPAQMKPFLDTTIEYMIQALNDPDDEIKMSSCTFWVQYVDSQLYQEQHAKYLPRLMHYLLGLMTYSETELSDIHCLYNTDIPRPQHILDDTQKKEEEYSYAPVREGSDLEEEEDSDMSEGDVVDDEFYSDDSLRKRSAQTLEALSIALGEYITPAILDHVAQHQENWLVRESGILALGAAAEGGFMVIKQHLPNLIPYLINSLQDREPLVRSISCWTMSRYSNWLVSSNDFFEPVLFQLLNRMLDTNVRVQESACTAFIVLCEASQSQLVPYLYSILVCTNQAFLLYGRRNRFMLYDALGTLADAVKSDLSQPQFIYLLMPPLISKWNELSDNDTDLFPLLECLSNITVALGPGFIQYVDPVLSRCVKLISSTVRAQDLADQYEYSPPNVEVLIAALDLLSGIVQGLGPKIEPLFAQTNLISLLTHCIHDPVPEVVQSSFTLIGDIACNSFSLLVPYLQHFFWGIIQTLRNNDMMSVSVYNNGLWSAGEMVMRWGQDAQPYVGYLIDTFMPLLVASTSSVRENAMVSLGRVCLACPETAAPYLAYFVKPWLNVSVREGEEKDSAFRGLCTVLKLNPQGAQKELELLLDAISSFKEPSLALTRLFQEVLEMLKGQEDWELAFSQLEQVSKKRISDLLQKP